MASASDLDLFETGFYTIGEVARLAGIPVSRARRWTRGYSYPTTKGRIRQKPLWKPELPHEKGQARILSFNELIEIRAIDHFCQQGISLQKVRKAIREFETEGIVHPFSNKKIITDGTDLYRKIVEDGAAKQNEHGRPILVVAYGKQQLVLYDTILESIVSGLGFGAEMVDSYFPNPKEFPHVVIDPKRVFGHPIIAGTRIEIEVIALAYKYNSSIEYVADWFGIDRKTVEEAVFFHNKILAA